MLSFFKKFFFKFKKQGSFTWALKKMQDGYVVKRRYSLSVIYRLDSENQGRIQWAFGDNCWASANVFVDDINAVDWVTVSNDGNKYNKDCN